MMDTRNQVNSSAGDLQLDSVDFRHLAAFQRVYQERNYTDAGREVASNRKSVVRMMRNLERCFDCSLFTEGARGELGASPFAERLFNDLRSLNAARQRMMDHIGAIHENGRVLHVGCSAAVFRTLEFRTLFRQLQSLDGIRACYSPIDSANAGKALVSGHCDLFVGCWSGKGSRFQTRNAGAITYRIYQRVAAAETKVPGEADSPQGYLVSLYGRTPEPPPASGGISSWQSLDEARWIHWLDHPEECPPGTLIFGPENELDSDFWQTADNPPEPPVTQPIHVSFLRQHSYEFLPALVDRIQHRTLSS